MGVMFVIATSLDSFLLWLREDSLGWSLLGWSATVLFFARFALQWWRSEKAKRVVMPVSFWRFSLGGALLNLPYCVHLWKEPLIMGAIVSLIVAVGNLELALHEGKQRAAFWKVAPYFVPVFFATGVAHQLWEDAWSWEAFGYVGEVLFSSRFLMQWIASEKKGFVVVPGYFWYLSLAGGTVRMFYAIHLWKMPLLIPTIVSVLMSARNAWLHHKGKQKA